MTQAIRDLMAARDAAWRAWLLADDAWQQELWREYPQDAGTRRYTADGVRTPRLARLHGDWHRAGEAYRAAQADYVNAKNIEEFA